MSYYILPKINNFLIVNPQNDNNECCLYNSYSLYSYYDNIKKQIEIISLQEKDPSFNTYDELIKIVNPYEYIFSKVPGSTFPVSKLNPGSNIFYDLLEIILSFNILELFKNKPIKTLQITPFFNDSKHCINLLRENYIDEDIFLNFNEINKEMYKTINNKKFDIFFFNLPSKSVNSYIINLIKCIMIIYRFQSFSGTSIIKIDCIFHKPIIDLIYLLCSLFEKVYIIKPNSNNITTYEKYIICKNFNVVSEDKILIYKNNYSILNNFIQKLNNTNVKSILDIEIPYYFTNKLDDINIIIGQQQLETLNQLINILKNKNRNEKIENIKKSNIQKAISWCDKFKVPYNNFTEKTNIFLSTKNKDLQINIDDICIDDDIINIDDI